jgi:hypothetical protein
MITQPSATSEARGRLSAPQSTIKGDRGWERTGNTQSYVSRLLYTYLFFLDAQLRNKLKIRGREGLK